LRRVGNALEGGGHQISKNLPRKVCNVQGGGRFLKPSYEGNRRKGRIANFSPGGVGKIPFNGISGTRLPERQRKKGGRRSPISVGRIAPSARAQGGRRLPKKRRVPSVAAGKKKSQLILEVDLFLATGGLFEGGNYRSSTNKKGGKGEKK